MDHSKKEDESTTMGLKIQRLPKELQDSIIDLTSILDVPTSVFVNDSYKPPVALQLNRRIRAKYAEKYYSTTVFEFEYPNKAFNGFGWHGFGWHEPKPGLDKWVASLKAEHTDVITSIRAFAPAVSTIASVCHLPKLAAEEYCAENASYGIQSSIAGGRLGHANFRITFGGDGQAGGNTYHVECVRLGTRENLRFRGDKLPVGTHENLHFQNSIEWCEVSYEATLVAINGPFLIVDSSQ